MKKSTKNILYGTLISAAVIGAGTGVAIKYVNSKKTKEPDKQKTELNAKKLNADLKELNSTKQYLDSVYTSYSAKHSESIARSNVFAAQNPDFNNMKAVYALCEKVRDNARENYAKADDAFVKKVMNICKRFCKKDGTYQFLDDVDGQYRKPNSMFDLLVILDENYDKIPNYESLMQEYAELDAIGNLIYNFDGFINNKVLKYTEMSAEQRGYNMHSAKKVINYDTLYFENGYFLTQEIPTFLERDTNVYKYNLIDNIQQDDILKTLYREYLRPLKNYNKSGRIILDEKLYREIMDFMLPIRQHNEIESDVASYNIAMQDVSVRKEDIELMISMIQQKLKVK